MSDAASNRDTVAIEDAVHPIYKRLTEGPEPTSTPFRTMKDVFMWAVAIGSRRADRRPLAGRRVTVFRWSQFNEQTDIPLLKALAITQSDDIQVLLDHEAILTIAEEYANAGIRDIQTRLLDE